jgi:maleate isomerase
MGEPARRGAGASQAASLTHMPFELDRGIASRAAIGLVVLSTDQTIEHEFRQILAIDGVAFYCTRIRNAAEINPASLAEMEGSIPSAAGMILPGSKLDVIAYGCTSGTVVIGEDRVFSRIRESRPDVKCTTPITGAIAGLKALAVERVGLLTPYVEEVNQVLCRFIEASGIAVSVMGSFNHENDMEVARITQQSIRDAMRRLVRQCPLDGIFVSCTSLRVASIAEELEAEIGVPVTSSNHAMAWHCLRLAGYTERVSGFGRLFRT